jgi:hypothetical protein
MPNFKPKATKNFKISKKYSVTLDNKHNEKMKEFHIIEIDKIPALKIEKKKMKEKIKKAENLEERLELEDALKKMIKTISELQNKKKIYLLNNSHFIFDYFEKKKEISEGNNSKKKVLHSFFNKNETVNKNKEVTDIQKYLINLDESYLNINDYIINYEKCEQCHGELIPISYEGILICKNCCKQTPFLIENEKPSYKEPPKEVCFYAYKRINHFREILAQFQAKETTQIPEKVISDIKNQIKKERITIRDITNIKAKDILKKLGYNKYYEHIPFIKDKLGIRPPIMSPDLEDKLCNLFMEIQRPYAKHCPDGRVNFLNYYYVLYKMCELLDKVEFLPFFPMLKDPVKRIEQDEIWKKICKELKWQYKATV